MRVALAPYSPGWWLAVGLLITTACSFNFLIRRARRLGLARQLRGVASYTLQASPGGIEVTVSPFGGTITRLLVPDSRGARADVVLGYPDILQYALDQDQYFGAIVGRCANRIEGATFDLNGKTYYLTRNEKGNHLHGGAVGLHKVIWDVVEADKTKLVLKHSSPDNCEGYPGQLDITATFSLPRPRELQVEFQARADQDTPVNIVQHPYFNLAGAASGATIHDHRLTVNAKEYTPKRGDGIPTGEKRPVAGTPFDFREARPIGDRQGDPAVVNGCYDHNFVLCKHNCGGGGSRRDLHSHAGPKKAALLQDPKSGRCLEVSTTAYGLHVYAGGFVGGQAGKEGAVYQPFSGVALETQGFPDAVHHPNFPSVILRKGARYLHTVTYNFDPQVEDFPRAT